jgi:hypothetical protein
MSDYEKLKALAEAAKNDCGDYVALNDYGMAVPPAVVLELIADLERNQRMLLAAACDIGAIGKALKADMNADGDELLGMVIDLKAQNTRMLEWLKDISRTSGDKGAVMGARQLLKEFGQ